MQLSRVQRELIQGFAERPKVSILHVSYIMVTGEELRMEKINFLKYGKRKFVPGLQTVEELLFEDVIFFIPKFQRKYQWCSEDWEGFLKALFEAYLRKAYFFGGGMLLLKPEKESQVEGEITRGIVDGQHRIIFIVMFFMVAMHFLGESATSDVIRAFWVKSGEKLIPRLVGKREFDEDVFENYLFPPAYVGKGGYVFFREDCFNVTYNKFIWCHVLFNKVNNDNLSENVKNEITPILEGVKVLLSMIDVMGLNKKELLELVSFLKEKVLFNVSLMSIKGGADI